MARPKRLKLKDEEGKDAANVKSAIDDETYYHELMRDSSFTQVKSCWEGFVIFQMVW